MELKRTFEIIAWIQSSYQSNLYGIETNKTIPLKVCSRKYQSNLYGIETGCNCTIATEPSNSQHYLHCLPKKASLSAVAGWLSWSDSVNNYPNGALLKSPFLFLSSANWFSGIRFSFLTAHRTRLYITSCITDTLHLCGVYIRLHGHRTWQHTFPPYQKQVLFSCGLRAVSTRHRTL